MNNIFKRLSIIQKELKAPKNNRNNYGNYNYRSAEDILSALKDIFSEDECILLDNKILYIEGRYYVEATATFLNGTDKVSVTAQAREEEFKKGMDGSQITGAATSYARKYALAGLFGIDNEKDADASNKHELKHKTIKEVLRSGDFTIGQGQYSKYILVDNKRFFIQQSQKSGKYGINLGTKEDQDYIHFEEEPTKEMIINKIKT